MTTKNRKLFHIYREIIISMAGSFELDTLLQKILESCVKYSNSTRGSIFIFDTSKSILIMRAEVNTRPEHRFKARYNINFNKIKRKKIGLTAFSFMRNKILVLNSQQEIINHPQHLGKFVDKDKNKKNIIDCHSLVCIPLTNKSGSPIGVIKLENTEIDKKYSDILVKNLKVISSIASAAIENFQKQTKKIDRSISKIVSSSRKQRKPGYLSEKLNNLAHAYKEISNAVGVSIWIIEGEQDLVCRGTAGKYYDALEGKSYDLKAISSERKLGITPWIAISGEALNIKTHSEMISHPQYVGTYNNILYPNSKDKCKSFIGMPLKSGNKIIGVIKADSRRPDIDHPEKYFTTEEFQIFSYLSVICSIIIERERDYELSSKHHLQLLTLYKLSAECYELDRSLAILWYLSVGLTHGEGLGFNRVTLFQYSSDKYESYLTGLIGIGPISISEGSLIQKRFNSNKILLIEDCKSEFFKRNCPPSSQLQDYIQGKKVELSKDGYCNQLINESLQKKEFISSSIQVNECDPEIKNILNTLDSLGEKVTIFTILDSNSQVYFGICDNVYSNTNFDDNLLYETVNIFLSQISHALARLTLQQSRQETTEEAWRDFTAITAHRVGSEATTITGALSSLKRLLNRQLKTEEWSRQILDIEESLRTLKRSAKDFSELQKPPELVLNSFLINDLLEKVKRQINMSLSEYKKTIEINTPKTPENIQLYGDEDRLLYIFKELCENAIISLPDLGKIDIYLKVEPVDKSIEITVSDNGPGISDDLVHRIFDRGFKDREGGTGLGLYIVKMHVEAHKGSVKVINKSDQGATFSVKLPLMQSNSNKILLVEDLDSHLRYLKESILDKHSDIEIYSATNEFEAIEYIHKSELDDSDLNFDYIIIDVNLTEKDGSFYGGISILDYIFKNQYETRSIIISAHSGNLYREPNGDKITIFEKAKNMGAYRCISKNSEVHYAEIVSEILYN